jgi:hypothetical protein
MQHEDDFGEYTSETVPFREVMVGNICLAIAVSKKTNKVGILRRAIEVK